MTKGPNAADATNIADRLRQETAHAVPFQPYGERVDMEVHRLRLEGRTELADALAALRDA